MFKSKSERERKKERKREKVRGKKIFKEGKLHLWRTLFHPMLSALVSLSLVLLFFSLNAWQLSSIFFLGI